MFLLHSYSILITFQYLFIHVDDIVCSISPRLPHCERVRLHLLWVAVEHHAARGAEEAHRVAHAQGAEGRRVAREAALEAGEAFEGVEALQGPLREPA